MRYATTAILTALCTIPLACAEPEPTPREHVEELLDEYILERNHLEFIFCDCWEEAGYDSRSECDSDSFYIGPSQSRCIKDAYGQDLESSRIYLECLVPLEREFTACFDSRLECRDDDSVQPCVDDYFVGLDDCIELPTSIDRALDACFD